MRYIRNRGIIPKGIQHMVKKFPEDKDVFDCQGKTVRAAYEDVLDGAPLPPPWCEARDRVNHEVRRPLIVPRYRSQHRDDGKVDTKQAHAR